MARGASKPAAKAATKASLHLRIDFGGGRSIGPGKIRLLELIIQTGSISAAGRALAMSYRQAWLLVDELNRMFREPVVTAQTGGGGGGGTVVTETGNGVVRLYREMERRAHGASTPDIRSLARLLAAPGRKPARQARSSSVR
ncbi:MAG: LysR family transcriptional regulator [Rhodospirillales bacterium]|nr:LysR family transcriptional regulator [Rhodospirillales bacterium]